MRRKTLWLFLMLCAFANLARAQLPASANLTTQGTAAGCTATSTACLYVNLPAQSGATAIELSGTWTGTVSFYGAVTASGVTKALSSTDSSPVSSATGNGAWQFNTAAFRYVLVVFTTASSGTVTVNVTTSNASARAVGGGGGGSSAFNAITSGTNTTAAMVVGTGASLAASGSGTIAATSAPLSGISGLGTGVGTALGINIGSAGAPVLFNGAGGTPSSLTLTNATGLPWNAHANPTGNLSLTMGSNQSFFNTTSAVAQFWALKNTTAAVVGTSQSSPVSVICGRGFHASADEEECATWQIQPGNGNDAAGTIAFGHTGLGTGVYTTTFPGPVQAGTSSTAGALILPQGTANGHATASQIVIEAPASVTAYEEVLPGAAATGISRTSNSAGVMTDSIAELSGDATTSGSNVVTVAKVNGNTYPANAGFTSGGVACATGTSTLSTSVLLTTNVLIKGGGAGACPGVSLTTDDGTTSTYTGTGGTKSPAFTATGSVAGFVDLPQGTDPTSTAPCNTATSVCEYAPTSVTSYFLKRPAAAPVIASYMQTDTCASQKCTQSFHAAPVVLSVTGDFTTAANTSLQTITGLSYTMPVSQAEIASFHCAYNWSQATATAAVAFGIQGATTAPTFIEANATSFSNTTAETTGTLDNLTTTTATNIVSVAPSAITTIWKAVVDGLISAPSNASPTVLNFMVSTATSGDAVTIKKGSACTIVFQ